MRSRISPLSYSLQKGNSTDLELLFINEPICVDDEPKQELYIDSLLGVPSDLRYHGYDYIQVCRGARSCVYQQTLSKETIGYEVFMIRIQPEVILYGKKYPARERWPKDDDFSKTAWSCWTLEEAMVKFNALEL
jgi:hypothetical protein